MKESIMVFCALLLIFTGYLVGTKRQEPIFKEVTGIDILKIKPSPDTVYIPYGTREKIKNFRPFVQDIVLSIYQYPEEVKQNPNTFDGRGFRLWIGNGISLFALYEPEQIEFTIEEKKILWQMVQKRSNDYLNELRINH